MDAEGEIRMSTIPGESPSPDHWRQALHFLSPHDGSRGERYMGRGCSVDSTSNAFG